MYSVQLCRHSFHCALLNENVLHMYTQFEVHEQVTSSEDADTQTGVGNSLIDTQHTPTVVALSVVM